MGNSGYSFSARRTRSLDKGYSTATTDFHSPRVFTQNAEKKVNEGMDPSQISLRESRDSEAHPESVGIVVDLDVTGSMGRIPAELCAGELPKLMSRLIEGCCPHAALLFLANGDLYSDRAPLQVGQFESGDEPMDHWLTTTYLEGNGGNNDGEHYSLGWLFLANMVETDDWDKRRNKGLFVSIGDEPLHPKMPLYRLKQLFGRQWDKVRSGFEYGGDITAEQAYRAIQERWNVHHINVGPADSFLRRSWEVLGEGFHVIDRGASPVDKFVEIVEGHMATRGGAGVPTDDVTSDEAMSPSTGEVAPAETEETAAAPAGDNIPDPV